MANNSYRYNSTGVGIHRVTKQPFDDKTVFYNPIDLLIYSKAGARYDGQQASLIYNNKQIDVIINHDQPILKFNNIEYYTKYENKYYVLLYYYNPFFNDILDRDMYSNIMKYEDNTISIDNPNRFNIINLMNIFRGDELKDTIDRVISNNAEILINYNEYNTDQGNFYETPFDHEFMFVRIGLDENLNEIKNNIVFTQDEYPFINCTESLNGSTKFKKATITTNQNTYTYFNCNIYEESTNTNENFILFPKSNYSKNLNDNIYGSDGYVTALYMEANNYVKSMLGEEVI